MTFDEFATYARTFNVIPVSKPLLADTLTPVSAYLRLRGDTSCSFLFESVEGGERLARYSFIGRDPSVIIQCKAATTTITEDGITRTSTENFFKIIHDRTSGYRQPTISSLPRFTGGLVGCIGYDAVRFIEDIPATAPDVSHLPDSTLCLFKHVLAFDHLKHQILIIVNVFVDSNIDLCTQYETAGTEIARLESLLRSSDAPTGDFNANVAEVASETSRDEYEHMVRQAKHYITDGDIFQVVLSQRFSLSFKGDSFNVYRALRVINPSPYLYYLDFGGHQIIGSSPELLVRVDHEKAEVYPIAGTRPRGTNDEQDKELELDLLADEKERAEHVMLVDLGRNDLGRVCEAGSVSADQLMFIVRYSHVMHIASRVTGRVANGNTCTDVLRSTFPAGTVSGAPKIRAMHIIDELEKSRRGIYAGGVGYFDFSGNMDMCIAIRTIVASGNILHFQAGAGIVADSDPGREYQETLNKAKVLIEAIRMAGGIGA